MHAFNVGLCARDEECETIFQALLSVRNALKFTGSRYAEVVVCLNGSYDKTLAEVNRFKEAYSDSNVQVIFNNAAGVVPAERKIVSEFPAAVHIFLDADSTVKNDAFQVLLEELKNDEELYVVYGTTKPLGHGKKSYLENISILYSSQKFLTRRYYFHGRLFAIRDWQFPEHYRHNGKNYLLEQYGYFLSLDDVYLSFYTLDKYGLNSIKEAKNAICYAWPISSFADWYKVYRRTNIELFKIKTLCSQFRYLIKITKRKTYWKAVARAGRREQFTWSLYLILKAVYRFLFVCELVLTRFGISNLMSEQWETAWSTKKPI